MATGKFKMTRDPHYISLGQHCFFHSHTWVLLLLERLRNLFKDIQPSKEEARTWTQVCAFSTGSHVAQCPACDHGLFCWMNDWMMEKEQKVIFQIYGSWAKAWTQRGGWMGPRLALGPPKAGQGAAKWLCIGQWHCRHPWWEPWEDLESAGEPTCAGIRYGAA